MATFRHRFEFPHPVEDVFAWHTRPGAFERLTPPWEDVRVREREGGLRPGGRVVLALKKGPAELRWEVAHTAFEENRLFVDEQVEGPFASWRHEHRFEPLGPDRCALEDVVEYEPPLGSLGRTFSGGYIERSLARLFAFRARRLANDLDLHARYPAPAKPLRVAVTGSTGLVGGALVHFLRSGGHTVLRMRRGKAPVGDDSLQWDPARGTIDSQGLEGLDAVVHLAGEPIAAVRWTSSKKEAILRSREEGTALLAGALAELERPPGVFISASGVDYYGDRPPNEFVTEGTDSGETFLAEVCRRWERATGAARAIGIRTVHLRTGIVLSPAGGMLGTVLLPFQVGVGGRIGSGRQYMSWIDLDDHVGLIHHIIRTPAVRGAVNSTAPNPVSNASFTGVLGRVLSRPTVLPLPSPAVIALMGEMGRELLLTGQRVLPERALASGYRYLFPDLEDSLRHQLGRAGTVGADG